MKKLPLLLLTCCLYITGNAQAATEADAKENSQRRIVAQSQNLSFSPVMESDAPQLWEEIFGHPLTMANIEYSQNKTPFEELTKTWDGKTAKDFQDYEVQNIVTLAQAGTLDPIFKGMLDKKLAEKEKSFESDDITKWLQDSENYNAVVDPALESLRGDFYARRTDLDLSGEEKETRNRFHKVLGQIADGIYVYSQDRTERRGQGWAGRHKETPFSAYVVFKNDDLETPVALVSTASGKEIPLVVWGNHKFMGQGLAEEGAKGFLRLLRTLDPEFEKVVATSRPENLASEKVMEKLGFEKTGKKEEWGSIRHTWELNAEKIKDFPDITLLTK